jgi:hypothetical protein
VKKFGIWVASKHGPRPAHALTANCHFGVSSGVSQCVPVCVCRSQAVGNGMQTVMENFFYIFVLLLDFIYAVFSSSKNIL